MLAELDAVRVELVVLDLHCLPDGLALRCPCRGVRLALGHFLDGEGDVHRPGDVHLSFHREVQLGGDRGAGTVGADEVLGADRVLAAGQSKMSSNAINVFRLNRSGFSTTKR
jgi:hypothetical protein